MPSNAFGMEVGANGDALTTSNTGTNTTPSLSGGTGTISTAQKMHGTRSALLTATTTSGTCYIVETLTSATKIAVRMYVRWTALPSANAGVLFLANGSSQRLNLEVTTSGLLRIRDDAIAAVWTSTQAMLLNTWYRVELYAEQSATVGKVRAAFFASDSLTAVDDSTLLTGQNTGADAYTTLRLGPKVSTGTGTGSVYVDDWAYDTDASGFLGAYVESLPTPVVTAGASTNPTTVGGSNGTQVVTWPAVAGATSYDAYIANTLTPGQDDFTLRATGVTSPYTFTGLPAGAYAFGIRAEA